ncbi:alpha-(1,3)-fucosyltransferase C-like [Dermacentor andersoni]|uniref:alpha-(1,3)-fucosyltransferase C-like n=1 Tax=Dermacentor andersoni TaxID=34620 RepID=UPI002415A6CA|nr:alpha-(1,3)-fucosyltransferase C-like [Dermacentor andersoni]
MTSLQRVCLFMALAALSLYYYAPMQTRYLSIPEQKSHSCTPFGSPNSSIETKDMPRIMMWTKFFSDWYGTLDDERIGEVLLENCPAKCLVTNDRRLIEYSDAVIFHVRDLKMADLPPKRFSWQKWVFFLMESPPHTGFRDFHLTHGMFNWTMTYRRDSDVYVPYGRVIPRDSFNTNTKRDLKAIWKSKKKTAVWMVSNCHTPGGREHFVAELKKYMDVDLYGACGDHACPKSRGDSCYVDFERTYFYALAFENSICVDYVSKKMFNVLKHNIIPVVFGGANYSHIAPKHSYIDSLSFESPKYLAEYLIKLSKNYTEYSAHFAWKERHEVVRWDKGFCDLCIKLQNRAELHQHSSYGHIEEWWFGRNLCRSWDQRQSFQTDKFNISGSLEN